MEDTAVGAGRHGQRAALPVKCVVWDLDETVWAGTLVEGDRVTVREGVREAITGLDQRGILQSIASRNDHDHAMATLAELGLAEYFLHPQIGWNAKSMSVRRIAEALGIGTDSLAFVDDQPFERDEVASEITGVRCYDAAAVTDLLSRPELTPTHVTWDARHRRTMYQAEAVRQRLAETFAGPKDEFLRSLDMRLEIAVAGEPDLRRAEELTVRTHQLNSTGRTYSYEQLRALCGSPTHRVLVARLSDRYGDYGNIGLAVVETAGSDWLITLLLMSCRVVSRGVTGVFINHIKRLARDASARLFADVVPTGRNRIMVISYQFNQFQEVPRESDGDILRFEAALDAMPEDPDYLTVVTST